MKPKLPSIIKPMTQRDLAGRLKISESYLSMILKGDRTPPLGLARKLKRMGVTSPGSAMTG